MSRGVFDVLVRRPTCAGTLMLFAGGLNDGWFSTLKNSARNSRFNRSVRAVFLNAAGLNHRSTVGLSTFGSPTISARFAAPLGQPVMLLLKRTEYGSPLAMLKMPARRQPP